MQSENSSPVKNALIFIGIAVMLAWGVRGLFSGSGSEDAKAIGQPLPELNLQYFGAKPDTKGKPMIVEFWATWCGPCRQSIPHLNQIYQKYKGNGLVIIGVSNEPPATVQNFMKSVPINYYAAIDQSSALFRHFGVHGIPHAFLINKEGKVVWGGHPMQLTDAEIQKIL